MSHDYLHQKHYSLLQCSTLKSLKTPNGNVLRIISKKKETKWEGGRELCLLSAHTTPGLIGPHASKSSAIAERPEVTGLRVVRKGFSEGMSSAKVQNLSLTITRRKFL